MTLALATVRDCLDRAAQRLAAAGVETPRVDAEWLLAAALGVSRGRLRVAVDRSMTGEGAERYETWVRRRVCREPLQHILGTQAFRELTLRVGPDVLVPRPETEMLVSWVLELLPRPGGRPLVLDVGTGSGCIACAIASERPDVRVAASDISAAAAAVARENVAALGLADRVSVSVGDLFSAFAPMRADLIVSNPPYIPAGVIDTLAPEIIDHEPRAALDGGPDGLALVRRLVSEAPRWLQPGAPLVLETFGEEQVQTVTALMQEAQYVSVATKSDLSGVVRFVSGTPSAGKARAIRKFEERHGSAGARRASGGMGGPPLSPPWGQSSEPQASDERRKGGKAPLRGL